MSALNNNLLTPWVAKLPIDQRICQLGSVADVTLSNVDKQTFDNEVEVRLCNYTDVYKNEKITSTIDFMRASALPREIDKFQVKKGDVLATKDSDGLKKNSWCFPCLGSQIKTNPSSI